MSLSNKSSVDKGRKWVSAWLLVGVVLVLGQIAIGGITRLTDSGLSITEWEPIRGTIPPLNQAEWEETFIKYKRIARQQYEIRNSDMTLSEFKYIYFWEWFHRLWARSMGIVFIIPFFIFLARGYFTRKVINRLGVVILLAACAAVMGWLMVASGLQEEGAVSEVMRTRVSAYSLIIHLVIATNLLGYLWWTYLLVKHPDSIEKDMPKIRRYAWIVTGVLIVQILLGGLMAGTKAGLVHPHFPFFVNGDLLYNQLFNSHQMSVDNFVDYEVSTLPQAWIQVFHRGFAYLLTIMILWLFFRLRKAGISRKLTTINYMLIIMLILQISLGVFTILNSVGKIPVTLGVLHQVVALLLFMNLLYVNYMLRKRKLLTPVEK